MSSFLKEILFHKWVEKYISTKTIVWTAIIFAVTFLIRQPIKKLLNEYIVSPFLSKIEKGEQLDFFFIVTFILILGDFFRKKFRRYILAPEQFAFLMSVTLVYVVFRYSNEWDFIRLTFCERIAIFDLIFVVFAVNFLLFFKKNISSVYIKSCQFWNNLSISKLFKRSSNESNENKLEVKVTSFLPDNPIENEKEDDLNRTNFAEKLAVKITHLDNNKNAFAIGIIGEWGSGKSSFINLVRTKIEGLTKSNNHVELDFGRKVVQKK
jgi:hypothetical protein